MEPQLNLFLLKVSLKITDSVKSKANCSVLFKTSKPWFHEHFVLKDGKFSKSPLSYNSLIRWYILSENKAKTWRWNFNNLPPFKTWQSAQSKASHFAKSRESPGPYDGEGISAEVQFNEVSKSGKLAWRNPSQVIVAQVQVSESLESMEGFVVDEAYDVPLQREQEQISQCRERVAVYRFDQVAAEAQALKEKAISAITN